MAKMMGKIHMSHCDCKCRYVSGTGEKCNGIKGKRRQRAREKRSWKKDLTSQVG